MAKHPHKLILQQRKTWRCTLNGCAFFVHRGLEHILLGKTSICWGCGDEFIIDEGSLRQEMPKCDECRVSQSIHSVSENVEEVQEMTPERRKLYKELGLIK